MDSLEVVNAGSDGEYIFKVELANHKTVEVIANHPMEVYGELFPHDPELHECEIIGSRRNPDVEEIK